MLSNVPTSTQIDFAKSKDVGGLFILNDRSFARTSCRWFKLTSRQFSRLPQNSLTLTPSRGIVLKQSKKKESKEKESVAETPSQKVERHGLVF